MKAWRRDAVTAVGAAGLLLPALAYAAAPLAPQLATALQTSAQQASAQQASAQQASLEQASAQQASAQQASAQHELPQDQHRPTALKHDRALELELEFSAVHRPSASDRVEYALGPRWSAAGTILLFRNLGLRLAGGMEYHAVQVQPGGLGVAGPVLDQPNLVGPHVLVQIQPTLNLQPGLDLVARLGVGWHRFGTDPIPLSQPTPLTVSERSGVIIEVPLSIGVRYALWADRMALHLNTSAALPLDQTGSLFDADAGASQSLRQDTGTLLHVAAFPKPTHALSVGLALDFFF